MLHFSLDSVDRDRHNASRQVDCYDYLVESVALAKGWGELPDILFTVTSENVHEIEEVYQRFFLEEGLTVILNPVFSYNEVGGRLSSEELAHLKSFAHRPGIYLNEAFLKLREAGGNQTDDPVCLAGSTTVVISPENKVIVPCYHLGVDELSIDGRLKEVFESKAVRAIRQRSGKLPECQGCEINCYMEPSMAVKTGKYFWPSLKSTLKYSLEKWIYRD